jgi:hypothetical protein
LIGGVEGTFLAPLRDGEQTVTLTDLNTGEAFRGTADPSLGSGIRTWLGMQREGWGFRFQYWHMGDESLDARPEVPVEGGTAFHEEFLLKADAIDIELTQRLCLADWQIHSSFGGRWARLERHSTVLGYGTLGDGVNLYGLATGSSMLEGQGFTFTVGGRKPLDWLLPCGWYSYWNYRGSLLWAGSDASALTEANAVTGSPVGAANSRDQAYACKDSSESAYISEVQVGVQYQQTRCRSPWACFFRAGMEYQHWQTGDVWAESNSYAFMRGGLPAFGGHAAASSHAPSGNLDLIGFVIAGGVTY